MYIYIHVGSLIHPFKNILNTFLVILEIEFESLSMKLKCHVERTTLEKWDY